MLQESDNCGTSDTSDVTADGAYITQRMLLEHVREQGYNITERQLERWHKEDCLPRPRHIHAIGVRGSSSCYPANALPQLLALCRLQTTRRYSFDELRLLLWVEGYQIPPVQVQASIQRILTHMRDELRRRGPANWRDTLTVAESLAAQVLPYLLRTALGRLIRRRLAPQDWASYLTMQFQLLLGGSPAFASGDEYVTEDGEALDKPLGALIVEVYGLQRAQIDTLGEAKPWLPSDIAPTLLDLARRRVFSLKYALDTIQRATPSRLEQALADRHVMFTLLPKVARGMEALFGDNAFGLGMFRALADWMSEDDATAQALLIVILLVVRRSGYGHALDHIATTIRETAAAYDHWQELLETLERELPEIASAITPDPKLANSHADHTVYMQARLSQIQEIAERQRDELRSFLERHPELTVEHHAIDAYRQPA